MKIKNLIFLLLTCFYLHTEAQSNVVQNILNSVRADSLMNFVQQLSGVKPVLLDGSSDTLLSRHYLHPGNEKAFRFIKKELKRYGYIIDSLQFSSTGKNIWAIKKGYKQPGICYMLGAHYDNLPSGMTARGADDNASGCSAVLEAARIFANANFPYSIIFAFWDEEERGLLGSNASVQAIGTFSSQVQGYINLDMIAWDGNNDSIADINVRDIASSVAFANRADNCNTVYNIGLNIHILNPGEESSDQASFWNGNKSAIGIGEEHHTDFYPYWHTPGDSLIHFKLSYFQKCAKLAYATLADCALDTVNIVGIREFKAAETISLYPNPFTENIVVQFKSPGIYNGNAAILNSAGQQVFTQHFSSAVWNINVSGLPSGIYFVHITTEKASLIQKLIK